ncbi:Rieske (2Fe-2S) protein [Mycobacterium sp. NPDC003449]
MFFSRRQALVGTGITLAASTVAGCATYGKPPATEPAATSAPAAAPVQPLAKTADVPVGSGVIVGSGERAVVLTQPTAGTFKGFSPVCTHAGCTVSEVVGASINCPCHGSRFNLDGTVAKGPAKRPLDTKAIAVDGDSITLK